MIDDLNLDPLKDLPPELAELDAELRDIRIAERPSFGPELLGELEREWLKGPFRSSAWPTPRQLLAASVAALILAGLSVPPARASLAELSRQSLRIFGVLNEPSRKPAETPTPVEPPAVVAPSESEAADPPPDELPSVVMLDALEAEAVPAETSRFASIPVTFPKLADRDADQLAIRRYYPLHLQVAGVGGTVRIRLWVKEDGSVDQITVARGSGEPDLDRAAAFAAAELRFIPAMRGDRPVETWVEFDMVFEPEAVETAQVREPVASDPSGEWPANQAAPGLDDLNALSLLEVALRDGGESVQRLGTLENVLAGEPPAGAPVLRWRSDAAAALERAVVRDPYNPAPFLALGRIRTKQGLRSDAKTLFESGLRQAKEGSRGVSGYLVAELSYELGKVLENEWLPWRDLGSLPTSALEEVGCSMPGTGDVDDLIALNYLCPQEMDRVLRGAFEVAEPTHPYRDEVLAAYAGAVEAHPGHVAANVELLLDMADDEWWFEMFTEARRFAWASHGHPYALLMSGLALHRMGRSEEAAEDFAVAFQGLPPEEVEEIEDLTPLVGRAAARSFRDMDEEEGRIAVLEFWRTLDPILITDVNEREVEHYARGAYAHLRFGGAGTDAGQVWARYGRPNAVRSLGEGDGLRTEFWDYGLGPDLTFRRPAASRDLSLTSEGRAYLTDLRQVFPHRYGTRSRSVFTLPAQLARFREGPESGGARLDIHTEVPEILSTGEADSLLVGLFLLDADGQRLAEERRSLSAEASPVRLLDVGVDGAEAMVLEFYNPRAARVAVVRSPVRRDGEEGEDSRISDLLLVDPAAPDSREISRTDSWVVPRTTANDASGDEVGLLFELYDVPASQDRYRMRVRLEPAEGGAVRTLPSRPSGETHFGEEWSRKPIPGPRSAEYVTLDFSDVPPGGYVLRLRVEFFGGYEPIEVARPIQRR